MVSVNEKVFSYLHCESDYLAILTKLLNGISDREFYGDDIKKEVFRQYQADIADLTLEIRRCPDSFNTVMLPEIIKEYESALRRLVSVKKALFLFEILQQPREMQFLTIKHLVRKYRLHSLLVREYLK